MHTSRSLLLSLLCSVGVGMPSTLPAQDFAAAHTASAPDRATPLLTYSTDAGRSSTLLPLGYDNVLTAVTRPANYLPEQLIARDSMVRRWTDRTGEPIRVWIQPSRDISAWDESFPAMARQAFEEWQAIGVPVRFTVVRDSAAAELHVFWTDRLGQDESGRTVWWSTSQGWITRARITLSTHASDGLPQTPRALRAVALHEIGHALGMGHTSDARNIMAPWVEVTELSDADRNTAAMLYQMRVGRVTAVGESEASAMQRRARKAP